MSVNDARIDVRTDGNGDAIVLLHGFPLARDIWDEHAAQLCERHLVIRPDLRGLGRSSVTDGPYLMEQLAGDLAAVLDALGVERTAIAGHSLGGFVALAFSRMYTERVTRLALIGSRLAADTPQAARDREELADRTEREGSIAPVVDAYLPRLFAPATLEKRSPVVDATRDLALRTDPAGAAAMLRGMAQRADSFDIAGEFEMPVLVVAGAADQILTLGEAREAAKAFRSGSLAVMGRSGHLPMLEEPEPLGRTLAEFFG